ncbi:hypothetical protein [Sphingomonas radiodurans]|uniref:hypothetical protein n=1 Tax=Sphingomonas radiodurans TaxID=2890321 RepID=UPI001E55543A|nr:hypothetical protein [Sphingomonas radiodurans]WBH15141.1 hypothetical protein LLW23_09720 [Sphingomonas radiodurans]
MSGAGSDRVCLDAPKAIQDFTGADDSIELSRALPSRIEAWLNRQRAAGVYADLEKFDKVSIRWGVN